MDIVSDSDVVDSDEWFDSSDTGGEIPEPVTIKKALYQDVGRLPSALTKSHFEEGLVYFMTTHRHKNISILGMIIEVQNSTFVFRDFYVKGSSRQTYHESGKDKVYKYSAIWRLAPRRELTRKICIEDIRRGQCIRFEDDESVKTVVVTATKASTIVGRQECGRNRGSMMEIEKIEIVNCSEIVASSIMSELRNNILSSKWEESNNAKTPDMPSRKPELKAEFQCPEPVKHKRL